MASNYQQFDAQTERGMKKNNTAKTACGAFLVGAITASLITWGAIELANKDSSSSTSCTNKSYLEQPEPTTEQADALSVNIHTKSHIHILNLLYEFAHCHTIIIQPFIPN